MSKRIACLLVPNFPLTARIRRDPQIARMPVAILETQGMTSSILAVDRSASRRGIRPGHSLSQALTLFPGLLAIPRDLAAEQSAQEALLEAASGLSPMVENAGAGCVFLDLQGVRSERNLVEEAIRKVAAVGLTAWVGVSGGRICVRVAARRSRGEPTFIPLGGEASFLAPFPLAWLDAPPVLIERLSLWGVHRAGELAVLPAGELAQRLGPEALALHRCARGEDDQPLISWQRPLILSERIDLEWPLDHLEQFFTVVHPMLERLMARLIVSGAACRRLDLSLALDPKGREERTLSLAAPSTEVKTLTELIFLELSARPPRAPVTGLALLAYPEQPRQVQFSLFGPATYSSDALATVIARLSVLMGAHRIGSPRRVDGHRPERHALSSYVPPLPLRTSPLLERKPLVAAIRVLRPKIPLQVQIEGSPPQPVSVKTRNEEPVFRRLSGKILVASGPWRLEEGWWSDEALARDYWDVQLQDGGIYRIFQDLGKKHWFADGIYD